MMVGCVLIRRAWLGPATVSPCTRTLVSSFNCESARHRGSRQSFDRPPERKGSPSTGRGTDVRSNGDIAAQRTPSSADGAGIRPADSLDPVGYGGARRGQRSPPGSAAPSRPPTAQLTRKVLITVGTSRRHSGGTAFARRIRLGGSHILSQRVCALTRHAQPSFLEADQCFSASIVFKSSFRWQRTPTLRRPKSSRSSWVVATVRCPP